MVKKNWSELGHNNRQTVFIIMTNNDKMYLLKENNSVNIPGKKGEVNPF